jgi:hypothetical protein
MMKTMCKGIIYLIFKGNMDIFVHSNMFVCQESNTFLFSNELPIVTNFQVTEVPNGDGIENSVRAKSTRSEILFPLIKIL